jgi:hypothetical protein
MYLCYIIQVQSQLPQILLVKELMTALMDSEEAYGECGECPSRHPAPLLPYTHRVHVLCNQSIYVGYYMATLEAATQHIIDIVETRNAEHGGV